MNWGFLLALVMMVAFVFLPPAFFVLKGGQRAVSKGKRKGGAKMEWYDVLRGLVGLVGVTILVVPAVMLVLVTVYVVLLPLGVIAGLTRKVFAVPGGTAHGEADGKEVRPAQSMSAPLPVGRAGWWRRVNKGGR